jgi:hypothetical protein
MGVHTTFVRSVDLDEWTQRQIDAMKLGGNANAATYFRKHGMTDTHTKIEKKYKSKAAQSYKTVLAKMVDAEAAKRGEGVASEETQSGDLLENLNLADQREQDALAQSQLAAAKASEAPVSKAIKASEMAGAKGRLITPPSSGNAPKVVLRKPASSNSLNILKKKPSGNKTGLRVNKLTAPKKAASAPSSGNRYDGNSSDDGFEDIDATVKAMAEAEKEAAKRLEEEELAKKLEEVKVEAEAVSAPPPPSVPAPKPPVSPPKQTLADGMARLKAENSDFFGGL